MQDPEMDGNSTETTRPLGCDDVYDNFGLNAKFVLKFISNNE